MLSEAPPFWWQKPDIRAFLLKPFSTLYGFGATRAMRGARREPMPVPVLCVGNLTVGGAGKTPVAIALAKAAAAAGFNPGILSRGHGGSFTGVHLVDPEADSARHVGDEPLLLARAAPVAVTADRAAGARLLILQGCDFLIMDDGFQSARIHIDRALIVIDGRRGIGNGHVIPGGPLRAPLIEQMRHVHAVVRVGEGSGADLVIRQAARSGRPLHEARTVALNPEIVTGRRLLAFAGIGDPTKFFRMLVELGGDVVAQRSFPDHHLYTDEELTELAAIADRDGLSIVTTAKDAARIRHGSQTDEDFAGRMSVIEIETRFEPESIAARIVADTVAAFEARSIG